MRTTIGPRGFLDQMLVRVIVKTRRRIGRGLIFIGFGEISKELIRVTALLTLVTKTEWSVGMEPA